MLDTEYEMSIVDMYDDDDDDMYTKYRILRKLMVQHYAKYYDRNLPYVREHTPWHANIMYPLLNEGRFAIDHHMEWRSFDKLVDLLRPMLQIDHKKSFNTCGKSPVSPESILHCTLCYLAGGMHADIWSTVGVSTATFYRLKDMGIAAINACEQLKFIFPQSEEELQHAALCFNMKSMDRFMAGCVGCIDGWLCRICAPTQKEVGNVNAFFSGHYQCYGLNVQAVCDHRCRFTFTAINNPGSSSDLRAYQKCGLKPIDDALPIGYFIAGDNAYPLSEHLLTPFNGQTILNKGA